MTLNEIKQNVLAVYPDAILFEDMHESLNTNLPFKVIRLLNNTSWLNKKENGNFIALNVNMWPRKLCNAIGNWSVSEEIAWNSAWENISNNILNKLEI